ncbi:MAG: hypothetical protein HY815_27325, partial [Candidatus Riflebacteria bacterium]|nr:hypothetical protein [Candidatus Riflebacteria bacterium]
VDGGFPVTAHVRVTPLPTEFAAGRLAALLKALLDKGAKAPPRGTAVLSGQARDVTGRPLRLTLKSRSFHPQGRELRQLSAQIPFGRELLIAEFVCPADQLALFETACGVSLETFLPGPGPAPEPGPGAAPRGPGLRPGGARGSVAIPSPRPGHPPRGSPASPITVVPPPRPAFAGSPSPAPGPQPSPSPGRR